MVSTFRLVVRFLSLASRLLVQGELDEHKRILLHDDTDLVELVVQMRATLATQQTEIDNLKRTSFASSTYVRWGRNVCPDHAELVYKGFIAGKKYNDPGSGTDNLCLPHDPLWDNYHDGNDYLRGSIYGTEIDHEDQFNLFPTHVDQQDMPCAVCQINKTQILMIPARNACYPGWTMEYNGYLTGQINLAGHYGYDSLCLDKSPEFLEHGGTNDNGHILYPMEAKCGSLPCPPYVDGRELTCVVCSK